MEQWLNCVRRVSGEFREKVCQKGSGNCGGLPDPLHGCVWEMPSMRQERCQMSTGKSEKELRRLGSLDQGRVGRAPRSRGS